MGSLLELNALLNRWLRWLRLRRAAIWALRGLAAGLAAGLAFSLAALASRSILQQEAVWGAAACTVAGLVLGAAAAFLWPVERLEAARFFDRRFRLRERVSTALELAQSEPTHGSTGRAAEIRRRQLEDALAAARAVDPRESLPLHITWRQVLPVSALLAALFLSWWLGAPVFRAAESARSLEESIQAEAARVEEIVSQVEAVDTLTREQKEALTAPLREAAQELQEAETLEQAVSILTRAEGELAELADPQGQALARALQEAGEALRQEEGGALSSAGESLASGQTGAAAQSLADIDPGELSQDEQERLAAQLEAAAQALAEAHPELSGQLQAAAGQIRERDPQAARESLQDAARTLAEAGERAAQGEIAEQARQQLSQGQASLAQGTAAGQGQGAGGQQPGTGGTGEGQGSGQGQGQAQGSSGGGAGRGESSEGAEAGPAAGTGPIEPGNGPGDGGERPYEAIYAPERLDGQGGQDIALPGGDQPGEEVVGEGDVPLEQAGRSQVPYTEVYQTYAEAYGRAIESGQVPAPFRDLVREYFSSLEPN